MKSYFWIPVVRLLPIKNLPKRLVQKWQQIILEMCFLIPYKLGLLGAKCIGENSNGNKILKLNRNYPLGRRGATIEVPQDEVIFEQVRRTGKWEIDECKFLAEGLKRASSQPNLKLAFLDIGANVGLVSLQTLNLSRTQHETLVFEPVSNHLSAIKFNLRHKSNVSFNNFALSDHNGESKIYIQYSNRGNSSLFKSVVPENQRSEELITLVDTTEFFESCLIHFDAFVIKSDIQGMDASILSRIPDQFWQKTNCAIIEVWALPEIHASDVHIVLQKIKNFRNISLGKTKIDDLEDLQSFWLNKTKNQNNLYLSNF